MSKTRAAGFTLIEAMIAMLVLAFGLLAVAGFQTTLSYGSDVAKQRTEATRLAQAKIEELRAFEQIATEAGKTAFADIASGSDGRGTGVVLPGGTTNVEYRREWTVTPTPPAKILRVEVDWTDRQGQTQTVRLASLIAAAPPIDSGALTLPAAETPKRRPSYGMPAIPTVGKNLGGDISVIQLPGSASGDYIVFNAALDAVIGRCTGSVLAVASLSDICTTPLSAFVITGFISGLPPAFIAAPQAAAVTLELAAGFDAAAQAECFVGRVPKLGVLPRDPGAPAPDPTDPDDFVLGFFQYACLIRPATAGAGAGSWSGSLQLRKVPAAVPPSLMQTNDRICRLSWDQGDSGLEAGDSNREHPDPYTQVGESLEAQNFVYVPRIDATTPDSCPPNATISGIAVVYNSVNLIP